MATKLWLMDSWPGGRGWTNVQFTKDVFTSKPRWACLPDKRPQKPLQHTHISKFMPSATHHCDDLRTETSCNFWGTSNTPRGESPCVSKPVCLPPGYDAWWCHQIPEQQSEKAEHSCGRNVRNALCQPFFFYFFWPPRGYRAAVGSDQSLNKQNRESSIYLTAACLLQKTNGVKGFRGQAWCTWQTAVTDNRRICSNESSQVLMGEGRWKWEPWCHIAGILCNFVLLV